MDFKVISGGLNLRSDTIVDTTNRIAVLPQGHVVTKLADAAHPDWWKVSTVLSGITLEGFVAHRHLKPVTDDDDTTPISGIKAAHLNSGSLAIARSQTSGRAYPLNEPGQPTRNGTSSTSMVNQLGQVIKWLNVENSDRYEPGGGKTFCNIYAYDYCYLANAYLPRVWWNSTALIKLKAGESVSVKYDSTVLEMNANSLTNWFEEFGQQFGWTRTFDITELQNAANDGQVCIISARRTDLNRSGHICAVVPETSSHQSKRSGTKVISPLQSQAGESNFGYGVGVWWTNAKFRKFGFWMHP